MAQSRPLLEVEPIWAVWVAYGGAGLGLGLAAVSWRRGEPGRREAFGAAAAFMVALLVGAQFILAAADEARIPRLSVGVRNETDQAISGLLQVWVVAGAADRELANVSFAAGIHKSFGFVSHEDIEDADALVVSVHLVNGTVARHAWDWNSGTCGSVAIILRPASVDFSGPICGD